MEAEAKSIKEVIESSHLRKFVMPPLSALVTCESELNKSSVSLKQEPTCLPALDRESREFRAKLLGLDEDYHPKVAIMARWAEWFFRRSLHNSRTNGISLVFCGGVGVGKSHVSKAVFAGIRQWSVLALDSSKWDNYPYQRWIDWTEMAEADRDTTFQDQLFELHQAQIVCLDDVGSETDRFKNGESASRLRRALAECEDKWLLLTTNLTKLQFMDSYDARVADRLSAAHWCDVSGVPSYRPKLRGIA